MTTGYGTIMYTSIIPYAHSPRSMGSPKGINDLNQAITGGIYRIAFTDQKLLAKNVSPEAEKLMQVQVARWDLRAWNKLEPLVANNQISSTVPFSESELNVAANGTGTDIIIPYEDIVELKANIDVRSFLGMAKSDYSDLHILTNSTLGKFKYDFYVDNQIVDKIRDMIRSTPLATKLKSF